MTGSLITMVGIFTLVTALPGGWIADRFGRRRVIAWSGIGAGLGSFGLLAVIWVPSTAVIYAIGTVLGLATGLFMAANWAYGTSLVPAQEAGRYMGVSNLAGAGAGIIGAGLGGPVADSLNSLSPGLGYFVLFGCYGVLFLLSTASLAGIRGAEGVSTLPAAAPAEAGQSPG
jgi:MFS family permease